jgi:predicted dithiol-disulfide oxidoreductase (DUF899 family)
MFDPSWDEGCPSCSFVVDNIGHLSHLHARDTSLVLVSRAPFEKLAAYRRRMGWIVPWYSSYGSGEEPSGRSDGPAMSWVRRHDEYAAPRPER